LEDSRGVFKKVIKMAFILRHGTFILNLPTIFEERGKRWRIYMKK
jgi:hypothetical protein